MHDPIQRPFHVHGLLHTRPTDLNLISCFLLPQSLLTHQPCMHVITSHACDHLAWEWRTPLPFAAKPFLYPHLCPLLICSLPSTPSSLIPTIYPSPTTNLPYPSHRHQTHFLSLGFLHPVVNPSTKLLPRWPPNPPPTRPLAPLPSVVADAFVQAVIVGTRHLPRQSTTSS